MHMMKGTWLIFYFNRLPGFYWTLKIQIIITTLFKTQTVNSFGHLIPSANACRVRGVEQNLDRVD